MEGLWSRFNPIYDKLKKEVAAGTVGEIQQVIVHFGCKIDAERVTYCL